MAEITKIQDTRRVFIDTLCELAEKDGKILLVLCDTGFNYIEKFQEKFPKQVFNFGVTEASSTIISAGLALSGYTVWLYSMINFVTFRVHEMVRNAVVMHKANVKIIGVKGSEKYKFLGFSHNLLWEDEEIEWLEKLMPCHKPKLEEVRQVILEAYLSSKPCYIRL